MVVRVDIQNHGFDALAFLQHFGRMFDAPRRDIGNMDKPVDSLFDFDKRAEIRQISHTAGDHGTDRVTLRQRAPRIGFGLLETERYAAVVHVNVENKRLDILSQLEKLGRMFHAFAPRHFRDMDKAFDSGLQFDKGAVVGQVHDFAGNAGADRIDLLHQRPWIRRAVAYIPAIPVLFRGRISGS